MKLLPDLRRFIGRIEPDDSEESDAAYAAAAPIEDEEMRQRMRRPIIAGGLLVALLFVGLLSWAFLSVAGAVMAPGVVRVENNSKDVRRLESGVVRNIYVREGQKVAKGQLLMQFDDTQNRSLVEVYQSNVDSARATIARFQAEAADASDVTFPPELTSRAAEPTVAALLSAQRALFQTRMLLYRSQAQIFQAQAAQMGTQINGMRIQAGAIDDQAKLVQEELQGVRELSRQGYAPNSRLLALERNAIAVKGQRGAITSDMARAGQSIGQIRLQVTQLQDKHQTEVADGIRVAQAQLADNEPKLRAVMQQLSQTEVRAPVAGYVFNLTQFTEGGVAGAGQQLMQIVPTDGQLVVLTEISPRDINDVKVGMAARVTISAFNARTTPPFQGRVSLISADVRSNEKTGMSFFLAEVTIPPSELAKAGPGAKLAPGMQANVAIATGSRSILSYLMEPFTDAMRDAMREK